MDLGSRISSTSSVKLVSNKEWNLITFNTVLLIFTLCGVVSTLAEAAGFWPTPQLEDLFPKTENGVFFVNEQKDSYPGLLSAIHTFSEVLETIRLYTVHIYLSSYLLLPYPIIMETQKVLLAPWLICGIIRSLLVSTLTSLSGIVLCAAKPTLFSSCMHFSVLRGLEICISLYAWASVHSFYHFLDRKYNAEGGEKVFQKIRRVGFSISEPGISNSDSTSNMMPLNRGELEEEETEAKLMERAAMAWIARETLENGDMYESDAQFSQYLTTKAAMELRQVVVEIAEKKKEDIRKRRILTVEERIKDSLDLYMYSHRNQQELEKPVPKGDIKAFRRCRSICRRNATQKELRLKSRQLLKTDVVPGPHEDHWFQSLFVNKSLPDVKAIEVQTDPLSPEIAQLFYNLEKRQEEKRSSKKSD